MNPSKPVFCSLRPRNHPALALTLLAACLGLAALQPAAAQIPPARACADPSSMTPAHLYGEWQLTLAPVDAAATATTTSTGTLQFERHPEYAGSVRGSLSRTSASTGPALQAFVSGDITRGEFSLDESADGKNMDAVWEGSVPPTSCGQEIRGLRRPSSARESSEPVMQFVLKKAPGWR